MPKPNTHSEPTPPASTGWKTFERAFEVGLACGLLICTTPLQLVIALLVKIDSPGPVLFRQRRAGRHGRPFWLLKFRSMCDGAEGLRPELEGGGAASPVFKLANDPRVTRVGRVLRRLSLDELPQLVNVVRGDMALVGPRPLPVSDLQRFERAQRLGETLDESFLRWHHVRTQVRPGLTGLWQVSGRNQLDLDGWIRYDCEYVARRSLGLDLCLLLRTVPVVLRRTGAL